MSGCSTFKHCSEQARTNPAALKRVRGPSATALECAGAHDVARVNGAATVTGSSSPDDGVDFILKQHTPTSEKSYRRTMSQ